MLAVVCPISVEVIGVSLSDRARDSVLSGTKSIVNCIRKVRKSIREGSWLAQMLERKPKMLVAIALANKMARAIWAMLTRGEDYRDPVPGAAA